MTKNALIVVDIQNDFITGGSLAVPEGEAIIPIINKLLELPFDCKVATQDWHPSGHCSFASTWKKNVGEKMMLEDIEQILWPDHCVQDTRGAAFSSKLNTRHVEHIVHKGTDVNVDSYSTFFDNKKVRSTGLERYLKERNVQELFFAGLTTEYCVFYSVLDALELGFAPVVVSDAIQGIDPADAAKAISVMKDLGVKFMTSQEVEQQITS